MAELFNVFSILFQSLFYWIFLSETETENAFTNVLVVSILVLLDFPFGVGNLPNCAVCRLVSILVLLDFPFGVLRSDYFINESVLFQSLFYWIFLSESIVDASFIQDFQHCFNPCSIGFSFRSEKKTPYKTCGC